VITNPDDPDGDAITFTAALAGGSSYVIDLHAMSVTLAGVHREQDVSASSQWFGLAPGDNDLTFTGCASVAASFRPAWE
jgi:phage-related protein